MGGRGGADKGLRGEHIWHWPGGDVENPLARVSLQRGSARGNASLVGQQCIASLVGGTVM